MNLKNMPKKHSPNPKAYDFKKTNYINGIPFPRLPEDLPEALVPLKEEYLMRSMDYLDTPEAAPIFEKQADIIMERGYKGLIDVGCRHGPVNDILHYRGYTKSLCTSLNHVVCHGIPSDRIINDGDSLNIDVTAIIDDYHGDTSRMFAVGNIPIKAKKLIDTTYDSMMKAIQILKPGIKLGDIGYEIQSFVEEKGYSVVKDFCGHGISNMFHEQPNVLHYGNKNTGMELKPGMTFTIEPMINSGKYDVKILNDGWTAVTKDKSLSAQFEHTVGITENGYEIFTESVKGYRKPPYI